MRKKLAYSLALLSIFVILAGTMNTTAATSYTTVGAKPGDSLLYLSRFSGIPYVNKTIRTVANVVGTKVYFNVTYYNNDTTINNQITEPPIDVSTGGFAQMTFIIASGLTTNDPTYPGSPYKINDSSTMTLAGASRTVDHFKMSTFNASQYYLEIWWDKDTGLMVKMMLWDLPFSYWENLTLVSTTAWSPSAPAAQSTFSTTSIIAIAGVGIVALVLGFVIGRHGKRRK